MRLIGLAHLLVGIFFATHAITTGRPRYWIFIIILMPGVGSLAYVLFELLPDLAYTRRGRRIAGGVSNLIDPDREWRQRFDDAQRTDSVDTKLALAEECERKSMWAEAIALYETAAKGLFEHDETVLFGLARAQFGAGDAKAAEATLNRLRAAHPGLRHQDAHLLYARILETQGRLAEALDEYEAVADYYTGFEARTRYGLLLLRNGNTLRARDLFDGVVRASTMRGIVLSDDDRGWLKVAKANL
jgi:hypothetical protein